MKTLPLLLLHAGAALAEPGAPAAPAPQLTLDPALYADALREVQGQAKAPTAPAAPAATVPATPASVTAPATAAPASAPGVDDWQAAMRDAGTELADVRLLVLLQRLNPLDPPAARAEDYAEALRLHHLMLAGNPRACLALGRAFRQGHFDNGLLFIQHEEMGLRLQRRGQAFQLPIEGSEEPGL